MSELLIDRDGPVARLTLNRPVRKNAWTPSMGAALYRAIAELDRDEGVRAIVVTGSGGAFCAGADLSTAGGDTFTQARFAEYQALEEAAMPWRLATPVIAAIDGPAVGVGATFPLLFDLRICSDRARIAFLFTRRGLCPEANSTWVLPRLIGASRAMDLLLTGRTIDAQEALALGLVSRVVPHATLLDEATSIAREIAEKTGPVGIGVTKRLVWRQLVEDDPRTAKSREDDLFRWIGKHRDVAEGVTAFLEKRPAQWTGKKAEVPAVWLARDDAPDGP